MPTAPGESPSTPQASRWGQHLVVLALLLPWINPFAPVPSSPVVQSLLSVLALAVLLLPLQHQGVRVLARVNVVAWLCAALLSCVIGLVQYSGASDAWYPWINGTGTGEAFANLRQRNQFATLTNIGLAALIWWQTCGRPTPPGPAGAPRRALATADVLILGAAALLGIGNAISSSRTGLLQLLLLTVLLLGWRAWRHAAAQRLVLVAWLAYLVAAVVMPWWIGFSWGEAGIAMRLRDVDTVCGSRTVLWRNVIHLIGLQPWTGWGWGELDYAHFITLYPGPRFCEILDNAHNLPLHLAVELGLPAALALCGLALYLAWRACPWRDTDPTRRLAWAVLAVIGVHSLLEYPLWYGPFQLASGVSLVLLGLTGSRFPALASGFLATTYASPRAFAARVVLAVLLLLGSAHAALDYIRVRQFYLPLSERVSLYRQETPHAASRAGWFGHWVDFAELTTTLPDERNADHMLALAQRVLHVAPEPRVIERLIASATLLGQTELARFYQVRYQAAFPRDHADWFRRAGAGLP